MEYRRSTLPVAGRGPFGRVLSGRRPVPRVELRPRTALPHAIIATCDIAFHPSGMTEQHP